MNIIFNRWLAFGVLLLAFIFSAACSGETDAIETEDHHQEGGHREPLSEHEAEDAGILRIDAETARAAGIEVMKSRWLEVSDYLETTGVVAPNEARLAHIRPLSKGVVERIFVLRGDDVVGGQPLIQYDNIEVGELVADYRHRQAEVRRARAQLGMQQKLWERGEELFAHQAIAEKELDLRKTEYESARETVEALESALQRVAGKLRRFGLSEEELQPNSTGDTFPVQHTILRSPFSGTIIDYEVAEGEVVSPERVLMSVSDLSTVWVLADVYEKDIGLVRKGVPVDLLFESYPERTFTGHITYLGDVVDARTRTVKVRCEVPNPGRQLKLGLFATIRIPGPTSRELPAVPISAIQSIEGDTIVFVQTSPGVFEKRSVKTGPEQNGWIPVYEGLEAGEDTVTVGSFALKSELLREQLGGGHAH